MIVASTDDPVGADGDETLGQLLQDPGPSPSDIALRRERHDQLMRALQQLEESHRSVIVLRDIEGCSYEEIAVVLRCQAGTVKSRLSRARAQLRLLVDGKLK